VQSTDFSQASDIALQYAIDMAQRCSAQTHLLHVVDDLSFGATRTAAGYVPATPELQQALVRGASVQLANAAGAVSRRRRRGEVLVGAPASHCWSHPMTRSSIVRMPCVLVVSAVGLAVAADIGAQP